MVKQRSGYEVVPHEALMNCVFVSTVSEGDLVVEIGVIMIIMMRLVKRRSFSGCNLLEKDEYDSMFLCQLGGIFFFFFLV